MDGTLLPERQFSNDWDGAWRGATTPHEDGWSAEIHSGIVSMPKVEGERRIGLYMSRFVAYLDERCGQHCPRRSQSLFPHFSQLLSATSIQNSSIRCSPPWALRLMGLITMCSTGLVLIFLAPHDEPTTYCHH